MKKVKIFSALLVVTMLMCTGFSRSSFVPLRTDSQPDTYQYCPDTLNGNVYYCYGNSYNVHDTIHLFKPGSAKDYEVFKPSKSGWDSYHVCDPEVIKGKFKYNGTQYTYLMAYLGCDNGENKNNRIGIAVSTNGMKWVRVGNDPLQLTNKDDKLGKWGIGQPSLIRTKDKNRYILFYTKELNNEYISNYKQFYRFIDFSDLDKVIKNPAKCMSAEQAVGTSGMPSGMKIQNADFARFGDYVYVVCDDTSNNFSKFKRNYKGKSINYPTPDTSVIYRTIPGANDNFWEVTWTKVETISPENAFERNHNCCFTTNGYGELDSFCVYTSRSINSSNFEDYEYNKDPNVLTEEQMNENPYFHEILESYRIYRVEFNQ